MTTKEKFDVYQAVTDRIVAALEEGVVPWRKPWTGPAGDYLHRNLASNRPYRGINQLLLSLSGFDQPYWLTMKKANEYGATVRKGERSSLVVFWKQVRKRLDESTPVQPGTRIVTDENGQRFGLIFFLRHYRVFNVDQLDGLPDGIVPTTDDADEADEFVPHDAAQAVLDWWTTDGGGAKLSHGGDRAFYAPSTDRIRLPKKEAFDTPDGYYATAFHECVHATGHASRLNRPELNDEAAGFGSDPYAREELVAELGAQMVRAACGIDAPALEVNAASYIAHWLEKIRSADSKYLVQTAAKSQRAADLILGEQFDEPTNTNGGK